MLDEIEYEENDESKIVRSPHNASLAYLRFINVTGGIVDIWWRDFKGEKKYYGCVPHNGFKDVNTFVGHVWCFTHCLTLERCKVNGEINFKAKQRTLQKCGKLVETRTKWNIHRDVRKLMMESIITIATCIDKPETAYELNVPQYLAKEIEKIAKKHQELLARIELCVFS